MYLTALHRREARHARLHLDVVMCGVAPTMVKGGQKLYHELRNSLEQIAN